MASPSGRSFSVLFGRPSQIELRNERRARVRPYMRPMTSLGLAAPTSKAKQAFKFFKEIYNAPKNKLCTCSEEPGGHFKLLKKPIRARQSDRIVAHEYQSAGTGRTRLMTTCLASQRRKFAPPPAPITKRDSARAAGPRRSAAMSVSQV